MNNKKQVCVYIFNVEYFKAAFTFTRQYLFSKHNIEYLCQVNVDLHNFITKIKHVNIEYRVFLLIVMQLKIND